MGKPNDKNMLWDIIKDLWDPQSNAAGYLNLGVAENALLHDRLLQHTLDNFNLDVKSLTFGDGPTGSIQLKSELAKFLTAHLKPIAP